jgi:hypothetical protein
VISIHTLWRNHIQEHRNLFLMLIIGLVLLEIEIFAMAVVKSGREAHLQISDDQGRVIYSVKGNHLNANQKADFERTFGLLGDHRVEVITRERPFPLRPWLAAAIGLPVGAVLLLGFFAKAYEMVFLRGAAAALSAAAADEPAGRLARVVWRIGRLNVFIIGGIVFALALGIWALPQLLSELGRFGVETIARYKWVVLGMMAVFLLLVIWIIYLRYLLARRSIEGQIEVEKYRLQLEISTRPALTASGVPLLEGGREKARTPGESPADSEQRPGLSKGRNQPPSSQN